MAPLTLQFQEIKDIVSKSPTSDLLQSIEDGYVSYSQKKVNIPPVGHLSFENPPGDVHIKYGYILGDEYYLIKIASGFYNNPTIGLNSSDGMMLLFSQNTGEPVALFLDHGYLTDIRTALAGAVVAKYLAPSRVERIGIIGTGTQARLQLAFLRSVIPCREVKVFGRSIDRLEEYRSDKSLNDFNITTTLDVERVMETCNLIITTTASSKPIIFGKMVRPGTHITAVGTDTISKQELDHTVFSKADLVVADSTTQCLNHGDLAHALKENIISTASILELGDLIGNGLTRENDGQITVADLTGVAIQDIQIAKYVYSRSLEK